MKDDLRALNARIAGSYELPICEDGMSPRYRLGHRLLVNPDVPPRAGDDVLLSRDLGNGTRETIIGRLVRTTAKTWRIHRLNPEKSETLDRSQWPKAELVTGVIHSR